jgi:ferredoxin
MLVINPDDCIDCGVCIVECPVQAIVAVEDLPDDLRETLCKLNHEMSRQWPVITTKKPPLAPQLMSPAKPSSAGG